MGTCRAGHNGPEGLEAAQRERNWFVDVDAYEPGNGRVTVVVRDGNHTEVGRGEGPTFGAAYAAAMGDAIRRTSG